ncbi:MAG: hypothetical protein ACKOEO_13035, partial [Planctomycetaceae bacterium]
FTTLSGNFGFERETVGSTTKIKLAATNVNAFLGSNPDNLANTGDEVGAQVSNARLGAVLYRTAAGNSYAIDAAGTASLVGIDGLTLSGSLSARINTTGGPVEETIPVPGGAPVQVSFTADEDDAVFSGSVTADAGGFASLSGGFSISKSSDRLKIAAAGVTAFVGAGDTGLRLTDGNLGVVVNTDTKKFAMVAGGNIALDGVTGFSLAGSGAVRINKLGAGIDETIATPAGDVQVKFDTAAEVLQLSGSASITIADFITGSATLNVEKTTSGDITTLAIQASAVTAFLGTGASTTDAADDMGVRLANGGLDLRIQKNTATNASTYVFGARGTIELVGIPSITAGGTIVAQKSTAASAAVLDFGTADPADDLTVQPGTTQFGGSVSLAIASFTTLSGNFGFERETVGSTTKIKLAATNVNAFLG